MRAHSIDLELGHGRSLVDDVIITVLSSEDDLLLEPLGQEVDKSP
jgi:hypothetical protein